MNENTLYDYWAMNIEKLNSNKLKALIKYYGNAKNLYFQSKNELEKSNLLLPREIAEIIKSKQDYDLEAKAKKLEELGISFITINDKEYPRRLININDAPYGIFYIGSLPSSCVPSVAIVGARGCSSYGRNCAKRISEDLAKAGVQIISGMAVGIDSIAQMSAIEAGGYSAAVLGTGVDICFPVSSNRLYDKLKANGCLISEYPLRDGGMAWHFPRRNRIISGLADAVVVVEARQRSGSLITVDWALSQGKEIFAVPGRINDPLSYSCNKLIAQGAYVVTDANDILGVIDSKNLYIKDIYSDMEIKKELMGLETDENMVYSMILSEDVSTDELVVRTKLPAYKISSICTKLELKGFILQVSKGHFIRNLC